MLVGRNAVARDWKNIVYTEMQHEQPQSVLWSMTLSILHTYKHSKLDPIGGAPEVISMAWDVFVQPFLPQHFLNFLPEPQGHGSFRPTLVEARVGGGGGLGMSGIEICLGPCPRQ